MQASAPYSSKYKQDRASEREARAVGPGPVRGRKYNGSKESAARTVALPTPTTCSTHRCNCVGEWIFTIHVREERAFSGATALWCPDTLRLPFFFPPWTANVYVSFSHYSSPSGLLTL